MNIDRRCFGIASAAALACQASTKPSAALEPASVDAITVIAYNVFGGIGWPYQRTRAKRAVDAGQMPGRLAKALGKFTPDIITLSESPATAVTKQIADQLEMRTVTFPSGRRWPGTLMTRYEILESQNANELQSHPQDDLFTRHWGRASLRNPSGRTLIVHSAHLMPGADPSIRIRETKTMLESMKPDLDADCDLLLMGDLNHGPDCEEYRMWIRAGLTDTFAVAGNGQGRTIRADIPKWRIDYVFAAGPIADRIAESKPLYEYPFRLDIRDTESFALSDHLPQLARFNFVQ